jgi:hypothetical protein
LRFLAGLVMRHFYSTTIQPEYENRVVLAHKGLQEQPEGGGTEREERKFFSFFVFNSKAIVIMTSYTTATIKGTAVGYFF